MSKPTIAKCVRTTVIRSLRHPSEYWQCGEWVDDVSLATRYDSIETAQFVIGLRGLRNVEVVDLSA